MSENSPLRVAVLSKSDASGGGASRVAGDVAGGLRALGHVAGHLVGWSKRPVPRLAGSRIRSTVATRLHAMDRRLGLAENVPWELPGLLSTLAAFAPDVVHVHDTSTAISPLSLQAVSERYPTLWTFHDCSAFTGGCLYPNLHACDRYRAGCGACPAKGEWPIDGAFDGSRLGHRLRRRLHATGLVAPVAPSRWMAGLADGSGLLRRPTQVISNCVDTDVFRPAPDRSALRRKLGLPEDAPVLLTSAGNVGDPRKGIPDAVRAARASGIRHLVLLGQPDRALAPLVQGLEVTATGYVSDRPAMAEWLAACDAFVFCSIADNQPLGVLEALSCGTPVFSYATGGIPDCVDATCGGTATAGDPDALAALLRAAVSSGALPSLSRAARERVLRSFSPQPFAEAHLAAFRAEIALRNTGCAFPASFSTAAA